MVLVTGGRLPRMSTALALIISTETVEIPQCSVPTTLLEDSSAPLPWETLREHLFVLIILVYIYHIRKLKISKTFLTCLKNKLDQFIG